MAKKRCAYLTMADPDDFVTDYHLSFEPMAALGWRVDTVAWRDPHIEWDDFDAVYICAPWDYQDHANAFIEVLERIERSSAHLVNDLSLVRWNLTKTYLRDLEERGATIVPSMWFDDIDASMVPTWFTAGGSNKLIIKPTVSANADDTFVLCNPVAGGLIDQLASTFARRAFCVQPFIANIQSEGEYSLIFFNGVFSHAILKTPKAGDFRVQEEHGADIQSIEASRELIDAGLRVLTLVEPQPVYVRADFVRDDNDRYLLMELELIEPSLYLRMNDDAPARFAAAFDEHCKALERT